MTEQTISILYGQELAELSDLSDKQKQILQASLELFSERGFEATSTQQIAERAGVSTGLVYKKFPSKEALLVAVLMPLFQTLRSVKNEFVANAFARIPETFEDLIRVMVRDRLTFVYENAPVIKLMVGQVLIDEELRKHVKSVFMSDLAGFIYPSFSRFKEAGQMADLPNDTIFQFLLSAITGYLGRIILDPNVPDLETEIQSITDFLMKGLSK